MTACKDRPLYSLCTQAQLKACGIVVDDVIHVPSEKKAEAREKLRKYGMTILALIGNTATDQAFSHSEKSPVDARPGEQP